MKKHDEGYVLALVMVVLLVICIVATSMMTIAMQGLKEQKQSVQQMQDRYAAEGQIEKFVALLEQAKGTDVNLSLQNADGNVQLLVAGEEAIRLEGTVGLSGDVCTVNIKVVQGSVQVDCHLKLMGSFDSNGTIQGLTSWEYLSYKVTSGVSQEVDQ